MLLSGQVYELGVGAGPGWRGSLRGQPCSEGVVFPKPWGPSQNGVPLAGALCLSWGHCPCRPPAAASGEQSLGGEKPG